MKYNGVLDFTKKQRKDLARDNVYTGYYKACDLNEDQQVFFTDLVKDVSRFFNSRDLVGPASIKFDGNKLVALADRGRGYVIENSNVQCLGVGTPDTEKDFSLIKSYMLDLADKVNNSVSFGIKSIEFDVGYDEDNELGIVKAMKDGTYDIML